MAFFRVLVKVSASDGSPVLGDNFDAYVYRKAWTSSEKSAREIGLHKLTEHRELQRLNESRIGNGPLRYEIVSVTRISFWNWLTVGYCGLLVQVGE
jgi:hypothetical protein